jgi:hypothetical protein
MSMPRYPSKPAALRERLLSMPMVERLSALDEISG